MEDAIFLTDTEIEGCDIVNCMLVYKGKTYKVISGTSQGLYLREVII